jgi:WD40 repeat protein
MVMPGDVHSAVANPLRTPDPDADMARADWPADHARSVRRFATAVVDGCSVMVTGDADKKVRIRDLDDGRQLGAALPGSAGYVDLLAVGTARGRPTLLTRDVDRTARIWNLADREELHRRTTSDYTIADIHFFAVLQGRFVSVTWEGRVWDLTASRWIGEQPKQRGLYALALETLEGRTVIVTNSENKTAVHLWDLATGEQVGRPLTGHTGAVWAAAAGLLDGRPVIATGGDDRTLRVWDAATGRQIGRHVFSAGVWKVAVASDGRLVVGFGSDIAVLAHR